MQLSQAQSQRFSFGTVVDTQYVSYKQAQTQLKLPYNPFVFDMNLTVFKTSPNYQQVGTSFKLSREKTIVYGRRKKQPKEWTDDTAVPVYLNAETVSEKHFSISDRYVLKDLGSKKGTFVWVNRAHPRKIEAKDTFRVAKQTLIITRATHLPKPTIEMSFNGQAVLISETKKVFLIGSHPKCDLVVPGLYHFQVCINVSTFTIFTHLDEEEASSEHGLWYRLRPDKKQQIKIGHGTLIMVEPYILKVTS